MYPDIGKVENHGTNFFGISQTAALDVHSGALWWYSVPSLGTKPMVTAKTLYKITHSLAV